MGEKRGLVRTLLSRLNRRVAQLLRWAIDLLYVAPMRRWIKVETLRYFVCGVGNYIVLDAILYYAVYHYVVQMNFVHFGDIVISPHVASMAVVFPLTFLSGFYLNRYVAFEATRPSAKGQMVRYAISIGGSIVLSYVALKILVEVWGIWPTPAKVCSSLITATYSYLMARYFTFRKA